MNVFTPDCEILGNDYLVAARNGDWVHVVTTRFPERRAYSPVWGLPWYIAETLLRVSKGNVPGEPQAVWVVERVIRWATTVEAVDGHRAVVRRGRQSRRRRRVQA